MKKLVVLLVVLAAVLGILCPPTANALEKSSASSLTQPGAQMARTLSEITGVAISQLLGVGVVGAMQYFRVQHEAEKARLPWFASPWFWVPALLVVAVCFLKDTAGAALPTAVKKPLDVIETVEHKISGLVATGAFVPIAVSLMHDVGRSGSSFSSLGFAALDFHWLSNLLMTPVAMILFFVVFLASNAINILILLSPFTVVDAALKGFRTTILASVVASAYANPWLGAAWALVVVVISYFIAGWSFRLSHFGMEFIWDYATFRSRRFTPDAQENKLFLSRKINSVPARTYGKLSRDGQGNLVLSYRPWLVLPRRTMTLPAGNYEAGHGLFYSEILRVEAGAAKTMILLPPRYQGHESQLVKIYALTGSREVGLRAAWSWLKNMLRGGAATQTA